jgi:hypothetical protein
MGAALSHGIYMIWSIFYYLRQNYKKDPDYYYYFALEAIEMWSQLIVYGLFFMRQYSEQDNVNPKKRSFWLKVFSAPFNFVLVTPFMVMTLCKNFFVWSITGFLVLLLVPFQLMRSRGQKIGYINTVDAKTETSIQMSIQSVVAMAFRALLAQYSYNLFCAFLIVIGYQTGLIDKDKAVQLTYKFVMYATIVTILITPFMMSLYMPFIDFMQYSAAGMPVPIPLLGRLKDNMGDLQKRIANHAQSGSDITDDQVNLLTKERIRQLINFNHVSFLSKPMFNIQKLEEL